LRSDRQSGLDQYQSPRRRVAEMLNPILQALRERTPLSVAMQEYIAPRSSCYDGFEFLHCHA